MQPATQPKAPIDKKPRKKKISASTKLKTSQIMRETPPTTQVADVQPTEVLVATANTTQSLDTSESAEEQDNQPKTADAKKVQEQNVKKEVMSSGLTSMGDVTSKQLMDEYDKKQSAGVERFEIPYDTESEIKLMEEPTDFDLHSMHDDEGMLVSGFKATESTNKESDKADIKDDEDTDDNIIDEMTDLNFFAAKPSNPRVPRMETLQSTVPELIHKPMNKELNALNTLETQRLLDSVNVFKEAKVEGENVSLEEDMALELAEEVKAKAAEEAKIAEEAKENTQGSLNQSFKAPTTTKPIPPVSYALIVHPLKGKSSKEKPLEDEPLF
nr:hypothetical protein [Tanacetum cinerariifolium]